MNNLLFSLIISSFKIPYTKFVLLVRVTRVSAMFENIE